MMMLSQIINATLEVILNLVLTSLINSIVKIFQNRKKNN